MWPNLTLFVGEGDKDVIETETQKRQRQREILGKSRTGGGGKEISHDF